MYSLKKLAEKLSASNGYYYLFNGTQTEAENFCFEFAKKNTKISVFVWKDPRNLFVDKIFIHASDPIAQKIDKLIGGQK